MILELVMRPGFTSLNLNIVLTETSLCGEDWVWWMETINTCVQSMMGMMVSISHCDPVLWSKVTCMSDQCGWSRVSQWYHTYTITLLISSRPADVTWIKEKKTQTYLNLLEWDFIGWTKFWVCYHCIAQFNISLSADHSAECEYQLMMVHSQFLICDLSPAQLHDHDETRAQLQRVTRLYSGLPQLHNTTRWCWIKTLSSIRC